MIDVTPVYDWETEPHATKLARQAWALADVDGSNYLQREECAVFRLADELEKWRTRQQRVGENLGDVNWWHAAHRLAERHNPLNA